MGSGTGQSWGNYGNQIRDRMQSHNWGSGGGGGGNWSSNLPSGYGDVDWSGGQDWGQWAANQDWSQFNPTPAQPTPGTPATPGSGQGSYPGGYPGTPAPYQGDGWLAHPNPGVDWTPPQQLQPYANGQQPTWVERGGKGYYPITAELDPDHPLYGFVRGEGIPGQAAPGTPGVPGTPGTPGALDPYAYTDFLRQRGQNMSDWGNMYGGQIPSDIRVPVRDYLRQESQRLEDWQASDPEGFEQHLRDTYGGQAGWPTLPSVPVEDPTTPPPVDEPDPTEPPVDGGSGEETDPEPPPEPDPVAPPTPTPGTPLHGLYTQLGDNWEAFANDPRFMNYIASALRQPGRELAPRLYDYAENYNAP